MGLCVGKKVREPLRIKQNKSEDFKAFNKDALEDSKESKQKTSEDTTDFKQEKSEDIENLKQDNVILRHYDFLIDRMSPDFGLTDKLYSNGTISNLQRKEIEAKSVIEKRNKILLQLVVQKNACEELFEALKICGQSHLVQYLEAEGVYRPEFGGNWPLTEYESTVLLQNYETLIDLLDSRDLVGLLYQTGVLSRRHRHLVSSAGIPEEQNKVLLEILRKGSLDNYWQTIRYLHLSHQSHIARIFESGGVIIRIDAKLTPKLPNQSEVENSLVREIIDLLPFIPNDKLEETYKNLLAVAAKHSISFYFLCSDLGDVDRLEQMVSGGRLKKFLEDLFNRLMKLTKRITVLLKCSKDDFSKSRKHLKAIQAKNVGLIYEPMKTTIQCLPLELLDTILQSAYLWSRQQSGAFDGAEDSDIIVFLGSVNTLWYRRILRKRLKKPIWPQLERINRRNFDMYLNFRGSLLYLEEAMQVEELKLTRRDLLSVDFLTDLQIARYIRQKIIRKDTRRRRSGKLGILTKEILNVRRGYEKENIFENFIRFLNQTKLTKDAGILERGGAFVKVKIRQPESSNTDAWSRDFSSRLNNLKNRSHLISENMKTIIQQLNEFDLEIQNSFVDRGVTVWLWCKSQNAVKALYKSKTLIDHLYRLANETDRNSSTKDIHVEELNSLKIKTISHKNFTTSADGELQIEENSAWVRGVTKLRRKFFVLCHLFSTVSPPNVVYVFDDQHPFRLRRKITLEEIKSARDFSSSEKNFCLYITDTEAKFIWKIRPPDEDKIEDGEFTSTILKCPELSSIWSFRMTITDEGQFLFVVEKTPRPHFSFGYRNSTLLICESESTLNRPISIDLPDDIYRPEQVAENSAGNFIFLHRSLVDKEHWNDSDEKQWVVSEVDRNGKTIIRQRVGTGNQWLKPGGEAFLLVDPNDRIFLADSLRHRLIVLDSNLRFLHSFTLGLEEKYGENRLQYPRKMYFDGDKNKLIAVGEGKVLIGL